MPNFPLGVIEGFYGKMWTDEARLKLFEFLAAESFNSFVYAPKAARKLRGGWAEPFTDTELLALQEQSEACSVLGICWGVGLSPLGAVAQFDHSAAKFLSTKLEQINSLNPALLCILFDDMHCEFANLAQRQLAIVEHIQQHTTTPHLIVCPTYYSHDPVLEKVFGARPASYWRDLGAGLSADVDVFWTGNQVCSTSIMRDDLQVIAQQLQRHPVIWDNYPVNDGEKASNFLNVRPFQQRDFRLPETARGHFSNPMNQCALSKIALHSLPRLYAEKQHYDAESALNSALAQLQDARLASYLREDVPLFCDQGLNCLDAGARQRLLKRYAQFNVDCCAEITGWLNGDYTFDPACLTES
ncbi:MAG: beta-N-acetylglucosaminidase domain-containing protein [Pseudomonadales bacterium]